MAEEDDVPDNMGGESTYVPGEEDTGDVPVKETPDVEATESDALPNGDLIHGSLGGSYELNGGYLSVDADAYATMTATATIYATKPEKEIGYAYDAAGLRVQKVVKDASGTNTTDYILHGKLITHQTVTRVAADGASTTDQLHFFYDKDSRPAMFEHTGSDYTKVAIYSASPALRTGISMPFLYIPQREEGCLWMKPM